MDTGAAELHSHFIDTLPDHHSRNSPELEIGVNHDRIMARRQCAYREREEEYRFSLPNWSPRRRSMSLAVSPATEQKFRCTSTILPRSEIRTRALPRPDALAISASKRKASKCVELEFKIREYL